MVMPTFTNEQQQQIAKMQEVTKFIKGEIHSEDNTLTIKLLTDNEQAKQALPQIQQALISSIATTLHTFFGVEGKIV